MVGWKLLKILSHPIEQSLKQLQLALQNSLCGSVCTCHFSMNLTFPGLALGAVAKPMPP